VAEADNPSDTLDRANKSDPDVVVLDISLPSGPSLPLIEKLRTLSPAPHVLVLSMHDDLAYVRAALSMGATGYVVKAISEQDLLQAIRSVDRGHVVIDLDNEALNSQVFQTMFPRKGGATLIARLSEREDVVLRLLGRGFTNQAVAEQLDVSPKTVATYRARIGEKLGLKTTAEFVKYAADTGMLGPEA